MSHPAPPPKGHVYSTPAVVTAGRVQRFFALLCKFGLDQAYTRAAEAATSSSAGPQPRKLAEMPSEPEPPQEITVQIDMGAIFRASADEGALAELAAIVIDVPAEEAANVPVAAIIDALGPFAEECGTLFGVLLYSGMNSASRTGAGATAATPTA